MQTTRLYTKILLKHVLHVYYGILSLSSWLLEGKDGHDYKGTSGGV